MSAGDSERALAAGQTHVWLCDPSPAGPRDLATCLGVLDPPERARHDRFWFAKDRATFAVAHGLVRRTLSRYAPCEPAAWTFAEGPHGRPEIAGPEAALGLRFNLSHTRGLVAVAVCREVACGVDVEDTTRRSSTVRIARRFFAPSEVEALTRAPEGAERRLFFRTWTLKEAYLKACGLGLAIPLADFSFDLGAPVRIAFSPRRDDDPGAWQLEEHAPTPEHALALALRVGATPRHRVSFHWGTPW